MKIFIDAGHNYSGPDTGAIGNGIKEQDITFYIAKILGDMFKKNNIEVKYSRNNLTDNVGTTLSSSINGRCSMANQWGADYFISLHCDSATINSAKGSHICIYGKGGNAEKMANSINPQLLKMGLQGRNEIVSVRPDLGVLRNTNMPAILIEMGFISNKENSDIMKNNKQGLANAIYTGMCSFLKINPNVASSQNIQTSQTNQQPEKASTSDSVNVKYMGVDVCEGKIINDSTYVPIRLLCEKLGYSINWDSATNTVNINSANMDKESAPNTKPLETQETNIEPTKYSVVGKTYVIEIDPRNIFNVETQCATYLTPYNNFVNSVFFMNQSNGITFPQGMVVNAKEVMSNYMTHGKPVATLIVHSWNDVELKYVSDITKEKNVWFAISGYSVYPNVTAVQEGFSGKFADVTRSTNRPIIGYRKSDNKIIIAVREQSDANRASTTAQNLGLDFAISLDAGGSTTLKINGEYKFRGDGRKLYGGIIWN